MHAYRRSITTQQTQFPPPPTSTNYTPPPKKGSITIYEPLSAQRTEAVEAAILKEALRRGKSKEHLKVWKQKQEVYMNRR